MEKNFGAVAVIIGSICMPLSGAFAAFETTGRASLPPFNSLELINLFFLLSWLIPTIAIIFGIIGIVTDTPKQNSIVGLILGIIGLIVGIIIRFSLDALLSSIMA